MGIKGEYNEYLSRYKKASRWIDDPKRTMEEIEKWLPEFERIIAHLGELLLEMQKMGINYSDDEVLKGFVEV